MRLIVVSGNVASDHMIHLHGNSVLSARHERCFGGMRLFWRCCLHDPHGPIFIHCLCPPLNHILSSYDIWTGSSVVFLYSFFIIRTDTISTQLQELSTEKDRLVKMEERHKHVLQLLKRNQMPTSPCEKVEPIRPEGKANTPFEVIPET